MWSLITFFATGVLAVVLWLISKRASDKQTKKLSDDNSLFLQQLVETGKQIALEREENYRYHHHLDVTPDEAWVAIKEASAMSATTTIAATLALDAQSIRDAIVQFEKPLTATAHLHEPKVP